nr:wall-associated receptor kinase-like 1 [Ipomoea batatas]
MIFRLLFSVFLFFPVTAAAPPSLAKRGCEEWCGNVSIPFPFGIGEGCALDSWFLVKCDNSSNPPKPYLNSFLQIELQRQVVPVSLQNQTVTTLKSVVNSCDNSAGEGRNAITNGTDLSGSPFYYSKSRNKFLFGGCGNSLLTQNSAVLAGCTAICGANTSSGLPGCYGIDCCESPIPFDLSSYSANFTNSGIGGSNLDRCNSAFLVDQTWIPKQSTSLFIEYAPVLADGTSVSNFRCDCPTGEEGNPYIAHGCQGIMISATILVFVLCTFFLYKVVKKRRAKRIKAKFFKQNGGLLLQQQLSSNEDDVIDRTKLFTAKELEKATDRFNENRILGRGEERSLATRFLLAMEGNRLFKILDKQVLEQGKKEDLMVVAGLGRRCLDLNGKKRPTMKEVVAELEKVKSGTTSSVTKNFEGKRLLEIEPTMFSKTSSTWTTEESCSTTSLDPHPLLFDTL